MKCCLRSAACTTAKLSTYRLYYSAFVVVVVLILQFVLQLTRQRKLFFLKLQQQLSGTQVQGNIAKREDEVDEED